MLAVDANQRWDVGTAIDWMARLAPFDPYWIEEPTSPDDILGHAAIARAVAPIRVATGEHVHNRIMFKQFLAAEAMSVCQIDACRLGGVNEVVAVLLLAAKFGVPVCPHAGGVGLCELVQHLSAFDYIAVSGRARRPDDRVRRPPPRALRGPRRDPRRPLPAADDARLQRARCAPIAGDVHASRTATRGGEAVRPGHPRPAGGDRRVRAAARRSVAGVLAAIEAANIRNYSIYRHGELLFAYYEYVGDDLEADLSAMAADPIVQQWWTLTDAMQDPYPGTRAGLLVARPCPGDLPHRRLAAGHRWEQDQRIRLADRGVERLRWRTSVSLRNALTKRFRSPSGARSCDSRPGCSAPTR